MPQLRMPGGDSKREQACDSGGAVVVTRGTRLALVILHGIQPTDNSGVRIGHGMPVVVALLEVPGPRTTLM